MTASVGTEFELVSMVLFSVLWDLSFVNGRNCSTRRMLNLCYDRAQTLQKVCLPLSDLVAPKSLSVFHGWYCHFHLSIMKLRPRKKGVTQGHAVPRPSSPRAGLASALFLLHHSRPEEGRREQHCSGRPARASLALWLSQGAKMQLFSHLKTKQTYFLTDRLFKLGQVIHLSKFSSYIYTVNKIVFAP